MEHLALPQALMHIATSEVSPHLHYIPHSSKAGEFCMLECKMSKESHTSYIVTSLAPSSVVTRVRVEF